MLSTVVQALLLRMRRTSGLDGSTLDCPHIETLPAQTQRSQRPGTPGGLSCMGPRDGILALSLST